MRHEIRKQHRIEQEMTRGPASYPVPQEKDDPRFRAFFEYWQLRAGAFAACRRADFDPLDVIELLGLINIAKIERNGEAMRFKLTLWGTKITDLFGGDFTGSYVDEIMLKTEYGSVQDAFKNIAETLVPHYWQVAVPRKHREFRGYRRLALPLTDEQGFQASHIIALILPDRWNSAESSR